MFCMSDLNNFNNENFQNMPNSLYQSVQPVPPAQKPPKKRKPHRLSCELQRKRLECALALAVDKAVKSQED